MMTMLLAAVGLAAGVPPFLVLVMGAAALDPRMALAAGAGLAVLGLRVERATGALLEGRFHLAVASELAAGSSLRTALGRAEHRVPELGLAGIKRAGVAGMPIGYLQHRLRRGLQHTGLLAASALAVLSQTGGSAAATFEGLALLSHDEADLERDRAVSTAQVRLSALVVGGLPLCFLVFLLFTGRFGEVAGSAPFMLIAGVALLATGGAVMLVMLRRGSGDRRSRSNLELVAQLVFIGLTAGLSLEGALAAAEANIGGRLSLELRSALRAGRQRGLGVALGSSRGESAPLLRLLAGAHVSGAPLAATVATFLAQARETRKAQALEGARKLPVKLLVPLSLLILPGFVLITIGPSIYEAIERTLGPLFP